jgi:kynurenine formamidase
VLWTGHDAHLSSPDYFWCRPQLTEDGAAWLVERQAGLVAADFPGIGAPCDDDFAVKRALHRGGVLTAEQLCNLAVLEGRRWHLSVAPIRIRGVAGSLVRAVGLVNWRASEIVDLSLDTYNGMPALGGAAPTAWTRANHKLTATFHPDGLSYQTSSMLLSEHAGTHIDSPYHFDPAGPAIEQMALDDLVVPAKVLDLTHKGPLEGIGPDDFEAALAKADFQLQPGDGAVVYTEHSRNFGRQDYTHHRPFISREGADWLARRQPGMVITDLIGLDEFVDLTSPVHNRILRAGIPQLQVLQNVSRLVGREAYVLAFPLKLVGGTGSPVRAFAALA